MPKRKSAEGPSADANGQKTQQAVDEPTAAAAAPANTDAAASSSSSTAMYAILCSRVTEVVDPDEEGMEGVEWQDWENQYQLQETEAKATDGKWYYNTRGRPATPAASITPATKAKQRSQRSRRAASSSVAADSHYEKFGDSGILVPKMEGPLVVYKTQESANIAAEEVMRELLDNSPFDQEVPDGTTAADLCEQGIDAAAAAAAANKRRNSSSADGKGWESTAAAAAAWSSKAVDGCVHFSATRSYYFDIWTGVHTIV